MSWDNPPVTWRELERRLSWNVIRRPAGPGEGLGEEPGPGPPGAQPGPGRVGPAEPGGEPGRRAALGGAALPFLLQLPRRGVEPGRAGRRGQPSGRAGPGHHRHDGMYGVAQFARAAARQAEQTGTPLRTVFGAELSVWTGGAVLARGGDAPGTPDDSGPAGGTPPAHRPLAPAAGPGLAGPVRNFWSVFPAFFKKKFIGLSRILFARDG